MTPELSRANGKDVAAFDPNVEVAIESFPW
jgi:hypothetical protein